MYAGDYKVIAGIPSVEDEYIVIGHNPKSPTPYGTWLGYKKDGEYDFVNGNYFDTKDEAYRDLIRRTEIFYE